MTFSPCIIIPVYNHHNVIKSTVQTISEKSLPIVLVNDGSNEVTTDILRQLEQQYSTIHLLEQPHNTGKGGAVKAGLIHANNLGYTHGFQIDADGQHNLSDIEPFLLQAKSNPDSIICGYPKYDNSVPKHRYYARYLTHIWVWIECLSFAIKDSMCGFRVYPLVKTVQTLNRHNIGDRMDFDTEILVKLHWENTPIINRGTKVTYPKDGTSHFQPWRDNYLISKMHTRLFFGMLFRLPKKLLPNTKTKSSLNKTREQKGSKLGIKTLIITYRLVGITPVYLFLYPIVLYYFLTDRAQRKVSLDYLRQLNIFNNKSIFRKQPGLLEVYKHFYSFGKINADKIPVWSNSIKSDQINFPNQHLLDKIESSKKGAVFLLSHMGNIDMGRALSINHSNTPISYVVDHTHADIFNQTISQLSNTSTKRVIQIKNFGIDTAIELKQRVDAGEIIVIAGDRRESLNSTSLIWCDFLGKPAPFNKGPFLLAGLLECPIYSFVCLKNANNYTFHLEQLSEPLSLKRKQRQQQLEQLVKNYCKQLEVHCQENPYQWFNFYPFWQR